MLSVESEVDRILILLRNKIRERGFTQLSVQEKLGWGRSYISQLLTKQKTLRVEQVLMILMTIGVDFRDFYEELYPAPPPEAEVSLDLLEHWESRHGRASFGDVVAPTHAREPSLRALVRGLVAVLVDKDVLTLEELATVMNAAALD